MFANVHGRLDKAGGSGFVAPAMEDTTKYRITLVHDPEDTSGCPWAVFCDDIDGCCSQGATREEAIENIRDCIRGMLDYLDNNSLPVIPYPPWQPDEFEGASSVEHTEIHEHEEVYA